MLVPLSGSSEFDRRWRLAVGYRYQEWAAHREAGVAFDELLKRYPDDPEALVARGSLHEYMAAVPSIPEPSRPTPMTVALWTLRQWHEAARLYRKALDLRADYDEAHLRLGRVAASLGQMDEARRELSRVATTSRRRALVAWAHLFLGQVEERSSDPEAALRSYHAALLANPRLQPAQLSLTATLQRLGRSDEALAVLQQGLQLTRDGDLNGWFGYHTRALHAYAVVMDSLWGDAQK